MRFLVLNDTVGAVSGSNQACARICLRLAAAGHEIAWAGRQDGSMVPQVAEELRRANVEIVPLRFTPARGSTRTILQKARNHDAALEVNAIACEKRPDCVLVCNVHNGLSPAVLPALRRAGVLIVHFPFDNWSWCIRKYNTIPGERAECERCANGSRMASLFRGCAGRGPWAAIAWEQHRQLWASDGALRSVGAWIAPTNSFATRLRARGVDPERILRLPFPIDCSETAPRSGDDGAFVFFGAPIPCKGVEVLADALGRCSGLSVDLFLSHDPPAALRRMLAAASRRNRIKIDLTLRWNTGLKERVGAARAVLIPSIWDSVGEQALFEAMSLGKCVIASDIAVHKEWIEHAQSGLVAKAGDDADLAGQLNWAARNAQQCARAGRAAHRVILQSQERWAERLAGFVADLISADGAGRGAAT